MSDHTLKLVAEQPIASLLRGADATRRLEASGVTLRDDTLFVAFDNMGRVARLAVDLSPTPEGQAWLGDVDPKEGYEAICWHPPEGHFYTAIESIEIGKKRHEAVVRRFDAQLTLLSSKNVAHPFKKANKGVEGLAALGQGEHLRLLALCEAPAGKGKKKRGEVLLLSEEADRWVVELTLTLPAKASFKDFSDLALSPCGKLAVVSQEDSAMWVGQLDERRLTFDEGTTYLFPRDKKGRILYGNVEGVVWLSLGARPRVAVVSDRAKDDQPSRTRNKEQAVHIFDLPAER